ncbi:hypothetical protein BK708_40295 [Bacillus thuringiensis serovar yunnanensis]|nr:hypothetical protein BK708_40295 [Bacillus thuringiensis serovar yunnanensis]
MQLKNMYKVLATTVVLGQLMAPSMSHADTNKQTKQQVQQSNQKVQEQVQQGLTGAFFGDQEFSALLLAKQKGSFEVAKKDIQGLLNEKQTIQSVRWVGFVKPNQTGEYTFSTSADQNVRMKIEGKNVMEQAPMKDQVHLEKNKLYPITIEYRPDQKPTNDHVVDFSLSWSISGGKTERVPQQNLLPQNAVEAKSVKHDSLYPKQSLFPTVSNMQGANVVLAASIPGVDEIKDPAFQAKLSPDDPRNINNTRYWRKNVDSDGKTTIEPKATTEDSALPDFAGVVGFTAKDEYLAVWSDDMQKDGLPRYYSRPFKGNNPEVKNNASTTGDPYSDTEKASSKGMLSISNEAMNPLVAAYPSMRADITGFNIYLNNNMEAGASNSTSITEGIDETTSTGWNVDGGLELTEKGPGLKVGGGYSSTHTTTKRYDTTEIQSQTTGMSYNSLDKAALRASLKYTNIGSASAFNVNPNQAIGVLKKDGEKLRGLEVAFPDKIEPQAISPGGTQTKTLGAADTFNSKYFMLTEKMVTGLNQGGKLQMDLTQAPSNYRANDTSTAWANYDEGIKHNTAGVTLNTNAGSAERHVAVNKVNEDGLPDMTVRHALGVAFRVSSSPDKYKNYIAQGESYTKKAAKEAGRIDDDTQVIKQDGTIVSAKDLSDGEQIAQYSKYALNPKNADNDKHGDWMVVNDNALRYNNISFDHMNVEVTADDELGESEKQAVKKAVQDLLAAGKSIFDLKLQPGWHVEISQRSGIEEHDFGQGKKKYYFNPTTGEQQTGEVTIAKQTYYFKKPGDSVQAPGGKTFADGEMLTGKVRLNGQMKYFGE